MEEQVELLRQFVEICKKNPALLYTPQFKFYKDYLESLGATIPPNSETKSDKSTTEDATSEEPKMGDEEMDEPEEELHLDMSGVIKGEEEEPLAMGDSNKDVTDEDMDKANEERSLGMSSLSDGDLVKALGHFTNAIELNPCSAALFAKRANILLKLNKPNAAIRDCCKAIELNADSALSYKCRGRANRLLGNFVEAHHDLAIACKLDYDEEANEWLKEVEPNAKKILEHNRRKERRKEEKEERAYQERLEQVRAARKKAAEEAQKEEASFRERTTAGGGSGVPPNLKNIFGSADAFKGLVDDPEVTELLEDDAVKAAYEDLQRNPASIANHLSNPKVLQLIKLITKATGFKLINEDPQEGTADTATATGDDKNPSPSSNVGAPKPPPTKVPEPELD